MDHEVGEICIPMQALTDEDDQSPATSVMQVKGSTMSAAQQIEDLERSIMEELESLEPLSDDCCIYRFPAILIKPDQGPYRPFKASIGPFHHGKEEYKEMQEHKRRYLLKFLEWTNMSLKAIIALVLPHETRLRRCYAETLELHKQKFVKMMLIDATFLIVLLLKARFSGFRSKTDRIFGKRQLLIHLWHDLIILDNQIPFFILEDLFIHCNLRQQANGLSMIELIHSFFEGRYGSWVTQDTLNQKDFSQVEHFLDFLRISQQPKKPEPPIKMKGRVLPTIKEMYDAGVKFELHPNENKLDVEFDREKGVLKIPYIIIDRETETLLKNLQQFEKFHCDSSEWYVNDYLCLLSRLVKDPKDVDILLQNGIMANRLGDDQDVATLLSRISWITYDEHFYFAKIVEDMNGYCKDTWNKFNANLKQNYFNTPWSGISVAAAAFLLILTVIQTVCSILQVT